MAEAKLRAGAKARSLYVGQQAARQRREQVFPCSFPSPAATSSLVTLMLVRCAEHFAVSIAEGAYPYRQARTKGSAGTGAAGRQSPVRAAPYSSGQAPTQLPP